MADWAPPISLMKTAQPHWRHFQARIEPFHVPRHFEENAEVSNA
jgi:hypothetical protein